MNASSTSADLRSRRPLSRLRLVLAATLCGLLAMPARGQDGSGEPKEDTPQAVVARWLELARGGQRQRAERLTTGLSAHRAIHYLPRNEGTVVVPQRSLGNDRSAAVVTNSVKRGAEGDRVFLFWLVRRDGAWKINKSSWELLEKAELQLRGFLEADGVHWHVERADLLGVWESGPGCPPSGGGVACGNRLNLGADGRYELSMWGPGGPDPSEIEQGRWRLADGRVLLTVGQQEHHCRIGWWDDDQMVLESSDGKGHADFSR